MLKTTILNLLDKLFSTRAAGIYILLFAFAIGAATFIENDFGTSSAQDVIFRSKWFELLLILFGLSILVNIWRFKMIKQKKWATLTFHLSIIIIIIGAGVTRYFGYEGMMHIREGETSNHFLSTESYLKFKIIKDGKTYSIDEPVYFSSLGSNKFKESYQIGSNLIETKLNGFIPNPTEKMIDVENGIPVMKVVVGGMNGREEYFLRKGDKANINGFNFNFTDEVIPNAFNVMAKGDSLLFNYDQPITQMVMATQQRDTIQPGSFQKLMLRSLYQNGNASFVIGDYSPSAKMEIEAGSKTIKSESLVGLNIDVTANGQNKTALVVGRKGDEGKPSVLDFGQFQIAISYGSKIKTLPFQLKCRDFILERYPGTDSPSSYASEVTLMDAANGVNRDQRIFMNNILTYGGYRFFQSSYDPDETGTYLSVNFDFWGTWISYIGYILLTIGMLMTFFSKNSRFTSLNERLKEMQTPSLKTILVCCLLSITYLGKAQIPVINKAHAEKFGELIVQDHRGRLKPVNTMCSEVLRKVAKKESLNDLTAEQVILSMMIDPVSWERQPLINVGSHPEVQKILNTGEKLVPYRNFFNESGEYRLRENVRIAQAMNPKDQGTLEKTMIKLDEKVNITNMVFAGRLLRLFPIQGDPTNTWLAPTDVLQENNNPVIGELRTMFISYLQVLSEASKTNNYTNADQILASISNYQKSNGGLIMPSPSKVKSELLLNKMNVFGNLLKYYSLLALLLLCVFFYTIFVPQANKNKLTKLAFYAMAAGFLFHSIGLALRWYVSGRAPWSNGYESMIYIGWTTMLAGSLFSRKSLGGLAATATLASTILLVASMSWLDPEITPLVPVLKSYWLTIHVSLEAGSYGFLMLGAVIGMLNLLLINFVKDSNRDRIKRAIKELTIISEITLLGGLFMVAIGTYLGGVWANESWGRYWGWDAKETWALVTILVYSFILHMRFIPGLQSIYAFNFASLFGFATVIMTYFGVNYYLSGLHSYAAGDPVPVPPQVFITAICLAILSIISYFNYRKKFQA